jgi:hypothetical protein
MSSKARRQIPALRKLLAERSEDQTTLMSMDGDPGSVPSELGDFSLALDMAPLLDGLDAVGDFTSDGDSSASDGGDGGGGGD